MCGYPGRSAIFLAEIHHGKKSIETGILEGEYVLTLISNQLIIAGKVSCCLSLPERQDEDT